MNACWCGNLDLLAFNADYGKCKVCGTLVSVNSLTPEQLLVRDDQTDFYGKQYWLGHQKVDLGFPDIHARARHDLTERNLHWLKTLLKYRLPPGRVIELGCAHGSFVALMKQAGFDSSGVEMSPWVVHYARRSFEVPVDVGPLENLDHPADTFDAIVLMDVLEHLPDPVATMRHCVNILKPDGLLLIQTPRFEEQMRYEELVERDAAFLEQLKSDEHLYLFSEKAFIELFRRLGKFDIRFVPAIFAQYDMFVVVGKSALSEVQLESIETALSSSPGRRFVLALLDLRAREVELSARLVEAEAAQMARVDQVEVLSRLLTEAETDRELRAEQVLSLESLLKQSEADRHARGVELSAHAATFAQLERDLRINAGAVEDLAARLAASDADRALRAEQILSLESLLKESEADRHARGIELSAHAATFAQLEHDLRIHADAVEDLATRLSASDADRQLRAQQIEALATQLAEAEADRRARLEQINALTKQLLESEADRHARGVALESHAATVGRLEENRLSEVTPPTPAALDRDADHHRVVDTEREEPRHPQSTTREGAGDIHRQSLKATTDECDSTDRATHDEPIHTIAVDLTPVLPGSENGGAKIFVIELLNGLARLAPGTRFVLLTHASAHEELATLDRPNVRRVVAVGASPHSSLRSRLLSFMRNRPGILPRRLRVWLTRFGYAVDLALRRQMSASLLRSIHADLLFCPFTAPTYAEPDIPTVCTIYDLQYKTHPYFFSAEDATQRDRTFVDASRRAAALVAISDYSRNSAIAHGTINPDRIRTIHLRMARRIVGARSIDDPLPLIEGLERRRYFIYPANFWLHKNHEMLITGFGMACRKGLPGEFKLVLTGGPGPRQAWLKEAVARLGLGSRILFAGFVTNEQLASLVAQSAGMVFPSLYEGFGLPVLEAMAAAVPVACSNTTSLPEVARDAAIFFDPRIPSEIAASLIKLSQGDKVCAQLVEAGLVRAAEFADTEQMVKEYWNVFQAAMKKRSPHSLLFGVHPDGWAGPSIKVHVGRGVGMRKLDVELSSPDWVPHGIVTLTGTCSGSRPRPPIKLAKGERILWSASIPPDGANCELFLAPTFVPAEIGIGEDRRFLSAMVSSCILTESDGEVIDLAAGVVA